MDKYQRYRLKDVEGYRKRKREWAKTPEQREKRRLYQAKWREQNREKHNAWSREWARKNPERHAANQRRAHLKSKFGITPTDYDRMLVEQSGGCAICGKPPTSRRLHVDHDHDTGKVRGLLCTRCNTSLGWLESHGEKAGAYLTGMVW